MISVSFIIELAYRGITGRKIQLVEEQQESSGNTPTP
jgi:hypothetical protein